MKSLRVALALVLGLAGSVSAAQPAGATTAAEGVSITVSPGDLGVLRPGTALPVNVTVTNRSGEDISGGVTSLYLNRAVVTSPSDYGEWARPSDTTANDYLGTLMAASDPLDVPAGTSVTVPFTIEPADVGLSSQSWNWGTRTLGARLVASGTELAQGRSSVVWYPGLDANPVGLATAIPITVPAGIDGLLDADTLAGYTSPSGVLSRLLATVEGRPVGIGVDPMIIASIRALGSAAPASALAWLARLDALPNDTFALGYADTDLAALSQAGQPVAPQPESLDFALDPANFAPDSEDAPEADDAQGTETPTPSPDELPALPDTAQLLDWDYTIPGVAWPADNTVVAADLAALGAAGYGTTVLSTANLRDESSGPRLTVDGVDVLASDATLSSFLRDAATAQTDDAWRSATTRLVSALAVIAKRDPGASANALATLGRQYAASGHRLGETLDAVLAQPWVSPRPLTSQLELDPGTATIDDHPQDASRLGRIGELFSAEAAERAVATVAADPQAITAERRVRLLALLTQAWRDNADGWGRATSAFLESSAELQDAVRIVEGRPITVLADRTSLPIRIENSLDQPVTVYVSVRPMTAQLAVEDSRVPITVEPGAQKNALVRVQSVSNGEVTVVVSLSNEAGAAVGEQVSVRLSVQAGWETAGILALAALVIAVFGFGIARNILKRRRERRATDAAGGSVGRGEPVGG